VAEEAETIAPTFAKDVPVVGIAGGPVVISGRQRHFLRPWPVVVFRDRQHMLERQLMTRASSVGFIQDWMRDAAQASYVAKQLYGDFRDPVTIILIECEY